MTWIVDVGIFQIKDDENDWTARWHCTADQPPLTDGEIDRRLGLHLWRALWAAEEEERLRREYDVVDVHR